ncbi:unnamed protein product [Gongylonema pulchrum]|uniref:5'-nucleotidase n=1 Tax=Gongylonema pulchrum TaxID=637853 RepID=A0A183DEF4_9BILA|nr:unnamed protein product [Gongylonema pulchrum]
MLLLCKFAFPLQIEWCGSGNSDDFRRLFNARDKDVLYIGDHIFGDKYAWLTSVLNSSGWRTFLVVPELVREISIWSQRHNLFKKIVETSKHVEEMYNQLDPEAMKHDIQQGIKEIRVC